MAAQEFEFEYDQLSGYAAGQNYAGYYDIRSGFFIMNRQNVGRHNTDGWKIHVSIDDEGVDGITNLANAWRIVAEELMQNDIYGFKIIGSEHLPLRDKTITEHGQRVSQRAKQITIYSGVDLDRDKDWQTILQNITNRLTRSEIRPSYLPQGDHDISGNPYFSYSYRPKEGGNRAEFSHSVDEVDPYATIVLTFPPNIERKQWHAVNLAVPTAVEQPNSESEIAVVVTYHQVTEEEYIEEITSCCGCRC